LKSLPPPIKAATRRDGIEFNPSEADLMSPYKQQALGIAGCRLAPCGNAYRLKDGTPTQQLAVTVSLLRAEPCLHRLYEAAAISAEEARAQGYRFVRSYDDALMYGLV
jgi:hypothetical protein